MTDIQEIKSSTAAARAIVEQKKQEVAQINKQLEQQQKALPVTTSQQALRQKFSGLQGLQTRQKIGDIRQQLAQKQGIVSEYGRKIESYEPQIERTEAQIREYEHQQNAYREAIDLYNAQIPISYVDDPLTRDYYLKLIQGKQAAEQEFSKEIRNIQSQLPIGDKLIVDFKNMRISGIESASAGQSIPIESYNAQIQQFNAGLKDTSQFQDLSNLQTRSSLSDRDFSSIQNLNNANRNIFNGELLPTVTARSIQSIQKEPNIAQRFQAATKDRAITGALGFAGGEVERGINKVSNVIGWNPSYTFPERTIYQAKGLTTTPQYKGIPIAIPKQKGYYIQDVAALSNVGVRTAPYFAGYGIGAGLMIGAGTEEVIRNPTITGKAIGAAEAGLGAYGLKGEFSALKTTRELKALEKTPVNIRGYRFEGEKGGVDVLSATRITQPKGFMDNLLKVQPQVEVTKINQPFYNLQQGASLEGGKGFAMRLTPKGELTTAGFTTSGRVINAENPRLIRNYEGIKTTTPLEAQAGFGRLNIKTYGRQKGKIEIIHRPEALGGDYIYVNPQTEIYRTPETERLFFGGLTKEDNNIITLVGGESSTLKATKPIYRVDDFGNVIKNPTKITTGFNPNVAGKIKRINVNNWNTYFGDVGGGSIGLKTSKSSLTYAEPLVKQAFKQIAPVVPKASKTPAVANVFFGGMKTVSAQTTKQIPVTINNILDIQTTKQKTNQNVNLVSRQQIKQTERQSQNFLSGFNQALGVKQPQREELKNIIIPKLKNIARQEQRQSNVLTFGIRPAKTTKITPREIPPIIPKTIYSEKGVKIVKTSPDSYLVMSKRYGQDIVIGSASTLSEAKRILKEYLQSTLAASGSIVSKRTGQRQPVNDLFGDMFTPSKKNPFIVVQKRGKRLSSSSEILGIQQARKGKTKRSKKINWFK